MYIIFEDKSTNWSYEYFGCIYSKDKVEYSEGNKSLQNKIESISEYNEILVYVDVVPDNEYTLGVFADLSKKYRNIKNIYIIPCFCYEYYALSYLLKYDGLKLNGDKIKALKLQKSYKLVSGYESTKTFEGFCKGLFKSIEYRYRSYKSNITEKNSALFVSGYTAYLENIIMNKYFKPLRISEEEAVRIFVKRFNTLSNTLGVNLNHNESYLYMKNM